MNTIAVVGACGKMGRPICERLRERGFDVQEVDTKNKKTLDDLKHVDLIIDFSTKTQSLNVLHHCMKTKTKLIMGTTGQGEYFATELELASKQIPIIKCDNFSKNMLKFTNLARLMSTDFKGEIAIVETHHKNKLDSPSGTAKHLINSMLAEDNNKTSFAFSNNHDPNTISVHSLRGGTLFGRHEIHFFDDDEEIVLIHSSNSRKPFINGLLLAVDFLLKQTTPGLYHLEDVFA